MFSALYAGFSAAAFISPFRCRRAIDAAPCRRLIDVAIARHCIDDLPPAPRLMPAAFFFFFDV